MPVEVIDLLSSPILAPNPPPRRATVNSTTPAPRTSTSQRNPPTDFIDIDDLSSSDNLPPLPKACASVLPPPKPRSTAAPPAPKPSDPAFLSDDIDSIFDLSQPYDLPPAKRTAPSTAPPRRRSPVAVAGVRALPGKNAQLGLQRSVSSVQSADGRKAGFKRARTCLGIGKDPITWTSSPDGGRDLVRETAGRRMKGKVPVAASLGVVGLEGGVAGAAAIDSDPFASSPAAVGVEESVRLKERAAVTDDVNSDPFASSPVVERGESKIQRVERASFADGMNSDPFDSSPVVERMMERMPSEVLAKSKGKGLDLTVESSDSDLPDFDNLITTQSKRLVTSTETLKRKSSAAALREYQAEKKRRDAKKDKVIEKAGKAAEKEEEKERKRIAKEEKAKEKLREQELAKVNTLRTDKKVSTPEMIVDLPAGLEAKLEKQVRAFLGTLGVQVTEWDSQVKNLIKWRRKVVAKYDEGKGHWEPCVPHVKTEDHVLVVIAAKEFVDLATADEGNDLDAHVLRVKVLFGDHIIYLIEGLIPWMRKNRNIRNRQYTEAVRKTMEAEPTQTKGKGKKTAEYVDEDSIEDALLKLQVLNGVLIHHTNALVETAEWIVAFTQHISTIPYRKEKMILDTNFCMETGQVKTGENASDTYIKMLQEIVRITAPIAYGIAAEYPTVQSLVKGLKENGPECLKGCRKAMNKDGGFSDRDIGVAVSKRVYKIFLGRDVGSVDI